MLIDIVLIILILFYLQTLQIVDDGTEASIAADNSLYIAVMFEVAGQVCAAKGHVSDEDRSRVYDMIKKCSWMQKLKFCRVMLLIWADKKLFTQSQT